MLTPAGASGPGSDVVERGANSTPIVAAFPGGGWVPRGYCDIALGHAGHSVLDTGREVLGWDFREALRLGRVETHPSTLPPLLAILCLAQVAVVIDQGSKVRAVVGHSAGDWAAAVAAGALQLEDAIRLLVIRGQLIEEVCGLDQATMLIVVGPSPDAVADLIANCEGAWLAARNGRRVTTLSVRTETLDDVTETLETAGAVVRGLEIPFGSHCPLMRPVVTRLASHVAKSTIVTPRIPFYSSVAPRLLSSSEDVRDVLLHNLQRTVVWDEAIGALLPLSDVGFVGLGPAKSGSALLRDGGVPRDRILQVPDPLRYEQGDSMRGRSDNVQTLRQQTVGEKRN